MRCDDRGGASQAFERSRQRALALRSDQHGASEPEPSQRARRAFCRLAAARGIDVGSSLAATHSDYEGGREAARQLLSERSAAGGGLLRQRPHGLRRARSVPRAPGFSVPDDISVIGFDDVPMAAWTPYRLTTLAAGPEAHRERGHRHARPPRADPDMPPISVTFPVDLVIRGTVRGLR